MLLRSFRHDRPAGFLLLVVLVPLLWIPEFRDPGVLSGEVDMPLQALLSWLFGQREWVAPAAGLLATLWTFYLLDRTVNEREFHERPSRIAALLFVLLLVMGPSGTHVGPATFGIPFALMAMARVVQVSGDSKALAALFDAGTLIGIAALFHLPFALLLVSTWATVSVLRPFAWREFVVPLIGCFLPLLLTGALLHLLGMPQADLVRSVLRDHVPSAWDEPRFARLASFGLVALGVAGGLAYASSYGGRVVRGKGLMAALLAHVVILVLMALLGFLVNGYCQSVLIAVPLALIATYALLAIRRDWVGDVVLLLLLALVVWALRSG